MTTIRPARTLSAWEHTWITAILAGTLTRLAEAALAGDREALSAPVWAQLPDVLHHLHHEQARLLEVLEVLEELETLLSALQDQGGLVLPGAGPCL